jgi:DNA-binding CsgD family transcriptional regulator
MNAMTMVSPMPQSGLRDRIVSFIKEAPDRDTRLLLKDVLAHMDKPYDLSWMQEEFRLSPAEFKVLGMLVEGKTPNAISEITGTATSTIRRQIHDVYKKTRVSNMAELMSLLLQRARNT